MLRDYWLGYRKFWPLALLFLIWWFAPSVYTTTWHAAWSVIRTTFNAGSEVASSAYGTGREIVTSEAGPAEYTGPAHLVNVGVSFEVNPAYHGWGQLLRSYNQLPEIGGRVYAAHIARNRMDAMLSSEASLIAQRRLNWESDTTMTWTDLRIPAPEYHLPIGTRTGWYVCVDLGEVSEGHNILGLIDDGLHHVHWGDWHLTSGDQPVAAGECVALDNNSFPYEGLRVPLTREGETVPLGWMRIDFRGADPGPRTDGFSTGAF